LSQQVIELASLITWANGVYTFSLGGVVVCPGFVCAATTVSLTGLERAMRLVQLTTRMRWLWLFKQRNVTEASPESEVSLESNMAIVEDERKLKSVFDWIPSCGYRLTTELGSPLGPVAAACAARVEEFITWVTADWPDKLRIPLGTTHYAQDDPRCILRLVFTKVTAKQYRSRKKTQTYVHIDSALEQDHPVEIRSMLEQLKEDMEVLRLACGSRYDAAPPLEWELSLIRPAGLSQVCCFMSFLLMYMIVFM
jgi:hypothetical protein